MYNEGLELYLRVCLRGREYKKTKDIYLDEDTQYLRSMLETEV